MVAVPNLVGLLNTAAQTAITNSGLTFSSSSTTNTGDSNLANKVQSQTPTSGTLADYESSVSFVSYSYVAPPFFPFFPPFFPPYFAPTPSATISNLTYTANGPHDGTLSWTGSNIVNYLYTSTNGATNYPSEYNYGAYTASWPGNLVNMANGQSYTVTITVNPGGASQTITFTHSYANAFPSFTTPLALSSKTSTSLTYSWDGFDALSWQLKDGATILASGNGFGPQTATRTGLTPNTSYTSYVRIWSGSGQTGNSADSPGVSATTHYSIWSGCYNGVTQGAGYGSGPTAVGWSIVNGTTESSSLTESEIRALIGGGCPAAPFFPPYFAPAPFFPPYFAPAPTYTIWSGCYNGVTQGAGYGSGSTAVGWSIVNGTTESSSLTESEIRALIGGGCPAAPFFPPYFAPAPFFPPYFAPAPFFPPYFAPSEPSNLCTGYDVFGQSSSSCVVVGECNPTASGDPC